MSERKENEAKRRYMDPFFTALIAIIVSILAITQSNRNSSRFFNLAVQESQENAKSANEKRKQDSIKFHIELEMLKNKIAIDSLNSLLAITKLEERNKLYQQNLQDHENRFKIELLN